MEDTPLNMLLGTHQDIKQERRRKRSVTIEDQTILRQTIIDVARRLLATGGFRAATMKAIAHQANIATGTVYLYFPSKAELFAEVFRVVSGREVQAVAAAAEGVHPAIKALEAAIRTFVDRAIRGRRMAYALIAEPVDPAIEVERLVSRRAFAQVFADVIRSGIATGELSNQDADIVAAALIGAINEALVRPLSPASEALEGHHEEIMNEIILFCLAAVAR